MPLVICAVLLMVDPASATLAVLPLALVPPSAEQPAAANAAATASVPDRRGSARGRNLPRIGPAHAAALPVGRLSAFFMTGGPFGWLWCGKHQGPAHRGRSCLAGPEPNQAPAGSPVSSRSLNEHVSRDTQNSKELVSYGQPAELPITLLK